MDFFIKFADLQVAISASETDCTDSKADETSGKNFVSVQRMGNVW